MDLKKFYEETIDRDSVKSITVYGAITGREIGEHCAKVHGIGFTISSKNLEWNFEKDIIDQLSEWFDGDIHEVNVIKIAVRLDDDNIMSIDNSAIQERPKFYSHVEVVDRG